MGNNYSTTITHDCERGQHLNFEDRVSIKIYKQQGHSLRSIANAIGCSPSTVMYELKRGTGTHNGNKGRFPSYSAKRGQANYEVNRTRCHRNAKALKGNPFVDCVVDTVRTRKWSLDACVGYAKVNDLFPADLMVCTKTLYNAVWSGQLDLTPSELPEAFQRDHKKDRVRKNKRVYGTSIEERFALLHSYARFACFAVPFYTLSFRKLKKQDVHTILLFSKTGSVHQRYLKERSKDTGR